MERALNRWSPKQVQQILADLSSSGQAQIIERHGVRFRTAGKAHFPAKR